MGDDAEYSLEMSLDSLKGKGHFLQIFNWVRSWGEVFSWGLWVHLTCETSRLKQHNGSAYSGRNQGSLYTRMGNHVKGEGGMSTLLTADCFIHRNNYSLAIT